MDRYILFYATLKSLINISEKLEDEDYIRDYGHSLARKALMREMVKATGTPRLEIKEELQVLSFSLLGISIVEQSMVKQ